MWLGRDAQTSEIRPRRLTLQHPPTPTSKSTHKPLAPSKRRQRLNVWTSERVRRLLLLSGRPLKLLVRRLLRLLLPRWRGLRSRPSRPPPPTSLATSRASVRSTCCRAGIAASSPAPLRASASALPPGAATSAPPPPRTARLLDGLRHATCYSVSAERCNGVATSVEGNHESVHRGNLGSTTEVYSELDNKQHANATRLGDTFASALHSRSPAVVVVVERRGRARLLEHHERWWGVVDRRWRNSVDWWRRGRCPVHDRRRRRRRSVDDRRRGRRAKYWHEHRWPTRRPRAVVVMMVVASEHLGWTEQALLGWRE